MNKQRTFLLIIFLLQGGLATYMFSNKNQSAPFVLITMLYNEKNPKRMKEYITCLNRNIAHELIETIHILYDTTKDDGKNNLLKYLQQCDVTITCLSGRSTYGDCFELANKIYPNKKIVLSNADIYFNHTLGKLVDYDLTNKFLALTRWDEKKNGVLVPYRRYSGVNTPDSQDVWIFQSPIRRFQGDNIPLGWPLCDGRIAYQAKKSGFRVFNPCMTIQCCHVHKSQVRNYNRTRALLALKGVFSMPVMWTTLQKCGGS